MEITKMELKWLMGSLDILFEAAVKSKRNGENLLCAAAVDDSCTLDFVALSSPGAAADDDSCTLDFVALSSPGEAADDDSCTLDFVALSSPEVDEVK